MQKLRKNAIFEAIQAVELAPSDFDLDNSGTEVRINHKRSKSYFIIGGEASAHYVGRYVVGDMLDMPYDIYTWDGVLERVRRWAQNVKLDLDTPDLWAELRREAKLLGAGSEVTENTPFTRDEQKEIARHLDKLAKDVRHALSLSRGKMQALEARIEYLIDAAGRLGRKDWLNIFIGVTLPFMLSLALPPESARSILLTCLRAIGLLYPELPIIE